MLDGVLGDEVDDGDGARLVLAPGTGDPLLELGGIPRQVAVDDDAGVLEIKADAAGIGAEEKAAVGIIPKGEDLAAALLLGDAAGVPSIADGISIRPGADLFQHAFPLGEDDDFHVGIGEAVVEDAGDFVELGAVLAIAVFDDGGRVANHPHHREQDHELVLLLLGEWPALGDLEELGGGLFHLVILGLHGRGELDEVVAVGAVGELGLDVVLAAAQQDGADAFAQGGEVAVV